MSGKSSFKILKKYILPLFFIMKFLPRGLNTFLWDCISPCPGMLGVALRYLIAKSLACSLGDNVYFGRFVTIKSWEKLSIGNNVSIHEYCYLECKGEIAIGDNVSIAHGSSLISFTHMYHDLAKPIKYNDLALAKISINHNVWIGAGVRILYGVVIDETTIIAANSVVNRSTIANSIYAGTPARKIKDIL